MKKIAELKKNTNTYTEQERLDFIVKYNHQQGCEIRQTTNGLEAWDYTAEEKREIERERINLLSLTAADVERALYKSRGIDFDDVINMVKENPEVDIKALKIELKANNFYRGNPYITQIGKLLGYSDKDLDYLFENKELPSI